MEAQGRKNGELTKPRSSSRITIEKCAFGPASTWLCLGRRGDRILRSFLGATNPWNCCQGVIHVPSHRILAHARMIAVCLGGAILFVSVHVHQVISVLLGKRRQHVFARRRWGRTSCKRKKTQRLEADNSLIHGILLCLEVIAPDDAWLQIRLRGALNGSRHEGIDFNICCQLSSIRKSSLSE
jgi:hypothetical protein